ncbi:MAG: polysaccharide biosynthesis protein, partial [Acidobacteria bacterium]|nr:polysaccharide biosynthesis protein [Acidobacteriota bacterium]
GLRPGEKLFEELLGAEEGSEPTEHARIFKARNPRVGAEGETFLKVEKLIALCCDGCDHDSIINGLADIVPTYKPQTLGSGARPGLGNW